MAKRSVKVRGVASMHALKRNGRTGEVSFFRSVSTPKPVWSLRLWLIWARKHMEYNRVEKEARRG